MKRVFIIHGWGGHPKEGWLAWLGKELESRGFEVHIPAMPDTENPKIDAWVPYLKKEVGTSDEDTYFVGHSIGCQTILRYLEKSKAKTGGVVCVAGWVHLPNLTDEERPIGKPWLETPIDFQHAREKAGKIVAIFSDDDPDVPLSDAEIFKKELGARIIIEQNKGHFTESDNAWELPSALDALLEMAK